MDSPTEKKKAPSRIPLNGWSVASIARRYSVSAMQQAGDEGAEGHGHAEGRGHDAGADRNEDGRGHEDLRFVQGRDLAQEGPEQGAPDENHQCHRDDTLDHGHEEAHGHRALLAL